MMTIKTLKPLLNPIIFSKHCLNLLTPHKLFSISTQDPNFNTSNKRPLDDIFKQALGLTEKTDEMGFESDENGAENAELKKRLYDLEMEVRKLKDGSEEKGSNFGGKVVESGSNLKPKSLVGEKSEKIGSKLGGKVAELGSNSKPKSLVDLFGEKSEKRGSKFGGKVVELDSNSKPKSLVGLFGEKSEKRGSLVEEKDGLVLKEITKDMEMLLKHLYELGYFKGGNFIAKGGFDVGCFDSFYARDFVKCAVEKFGNDNQHIIKWLSGSDLKTLANFGCPSMEKRDVFASKRLRLFFEIPEETVCSKCSLKESCKFVNQSMWGLQNKNLRLDLLMRLLKTYAMKDIPAQLKLTEELEACVSRLIHEIINLSKKT